MYFLPTLALPLPEDSALGTYVGKVTARDPDHNDKLTYSVIAPTSFAISDNDVIVNGLLDYETERVIDVVIMVSDGGIPPYEVRKCHIKVSLDNKL